MVLSEEAAATDDPDDVKVAEDEDEDQHGAEAYEVDEGLFCRRDPLSPAGDLHDDERHAPPVEHRQRQDVEDRKVDAENAGEVNEAAPAGLPYHFARRLSNADRPGNSGLRAAFHPGNN